MTQLYSKCLPLTLLFVALATGAQQRLDWPDTFTGQPDFDFTREEVIADFERRQTETGIAVEVGTLNQVLVPIAMDPLGLQQRQNNTQTNNRPDSAVQRTFAFDEDTGLDMVVSLTPAGQTSITTDLGEFRTYLNNLLNNQTQQRDIQLTSRDIQRYLGRLKLQSVVTAPMQYAIINNQRYSIGDTFTVPVSYTPDTEQAEALLTNALPAQSAVRADTYAQLVTIKNDVLAEYTAALKANPAQFSRVVPIEITVTNIGSRQVMLAANGKPYVLALRLAL